MGIRKVASKVAASKQDKRRWLDFITWYHQALIDFAEQSIRTVLKYYPKEKVRTKVAIEAARSALPPPPRPYQARW